MIRRSFLPLTAFVAGLLGATPVGAQQVCLPAPRLLTVTPMGGQAGTSVEVRITHQHGETPRELLFSTPKITSQPVMAADGSLAPDRFLVTIAADAPVGVHEARILSRLGVSSPRAFAVGDLPEVIRASANTSPQTALQLPLPAVCNATTTAQAIDFYSFQAVKGKRVVIDCNAMGIDSKLTPVVIVADAGGRDLLVSRDGGMLDFTPPDDGTYLIKVHGLAFQGGGEQFYRLALRDVPGTGPAPRQHAVQRVSGFSWPPEGLLGTAPTTEAEPNDTPGAAQKISLPCDVSGCFIPAHDADVFEFQGKRGETWWIEVASERLGMNTDPFVLVQRVVTTDGKETVTDVAELDDIAHPVKPGTFIPASTYTGPPYIAGSPDVLGKLTIDEDGLYRLRLRDLLGGPGTDAGSLYRLVVRRAAPDFALVAWAAHVQMRQNDFGTFSKPIALRAGGTMALEVVVVRRDGFDGAIDLSMDGLPPGVRAAGLTIPAGKQQGMLFVTADEKAAPAWSLAQIFGRARIDGMEVTRPCRLASVVWSIDYAPNDFPRSRLTADVPVSVTDIEKATASIAAAEEKVWEARVGETLKIPLRITWREEFNGGSIKLKPFGTVFAGMKPVDLPITASTAEAVIDLAALKTPPGDYLLAFNGISVVKHRSHAAVAGAAVKASQPAGPEAAAPKDILDFLVSEPIRITVLPASPSR